jgi:tRNA(fMet)-specific endonuclease VapC
MSGRFLLDTNIVIALFNGDNKITKWIERAAEIFLPHIVVGELYYGSLKSKLKKDNIRKIEDFILSVPVICPDIDTAGYTAE